MKGRIATKKRFIILTITGTCLIVFSILFKSIVNSIIGKEIKANIVLKPGNTLRYQQWKFPTIPIYTSFYLFTVVNPLEVVQNGARPFVKQLGPYTYREYLYKANISFNNDGTNVSYNQKSWFEFSKENSCGNCDPKTDRITSVNLPYVIMAEVAKGYPASVRFAIDAFLTLNKEGIFMERSVHEVIWGYDDAIFKLFADWKKEFHFDFIPDISPVMNLQPNDTFQGDVTVNTGLNDVKFVSMWESWRGRNNVNLWKSRYANMLNGSDGTQFPPGSTRGDTLYFFSPNLCRSIFVRFESDREIKGIGAYRFTTPLEVFQNATYVPGNKDFCLTRCYPSGILTGSRSCKPSAIPSPIVVSTPHFLLGDPQLRAQVQGLSPNKETHGLFLDIEPTTGIPLQALIRLQINAHVQKVEGLKQTRDLREAFIPLMYFSTDATVDDAMAKMMRHDIMMPINACMIIGILLYCAGGLLLVIAVAMVIVLFRRRGDYIGDKRSVVYEAEEDDDESKPLLHS